MCKEGIRIARQTQCNTTIFTANNAAIARLFPANPDRIALTVGFGQNGNIGTSSLAHIRGGNQAASPMIAAVSTWSPFAKVTVEELGTMLQGEIWGQGNDAASPQIVVTETILLRELKDA